MTKKIVNGIKMLGSWILCIKEEAPEMAMKGVLYVPDTHKRNSPYFMVHKHGPDCHSAIRLGSVLISNPSSQSSKDEFRIGDRKLCFMNSIEVQAINISGSVIPLGNRVLVKRRYDINSESKSGENGLIIQPEQWRAEQTLYCEIAKFGIPDDGSTPRKNGLKIGDVCKLKKWEQNMFEIDLGGHYYLIVDIDDIEIKF